jgi:hypothetical protein
MAERASGPRPRWFPGRRTLGRVRRNVGPAWRRLSVSRRPLPDFLIVGAQKCGTTSLLAYLTEHPRVSPPIAREVHYFDLSYGRGPGWYRTHFRPPDQPDRIAGESSPYYLFHPLVPERVCRDLPEIKLIVLLRDPVARAFSHYNHERTHGWEELSFEQALAREAERLAGEEERIVGEPGYNSFAHQHHGYVSRGRYAEQLERWFRHADRERFLILSAEDLFEDPRATTVEAQRFLGLEPDPPSNLRPRNARSYRPLDDGVRARLRAAFEPHNQRLYELVGRDFGWS